MTRNWGYPNGQIPATAMVVVRGEYFQPDAGNALAAMEAAAQQELGHQLPVAQGYRPLGSPSDAADANAPTQWAAWNNYKKRGSPIAAVPGTSNHGDGCAADMTSPAGSFGTAEHTWMVNNAPRFGWKWGGTPSEPWHIDYVGPITFTSANGAATPINNTPTNGDPDMPNLYWETNGTGWFGAVSVANMQQWQILVRYTNSTPAKPDTFNAVERDWIRSYLALNNAYGIPAPTMPTLDSTKLADAIAAALATKNISTTISASDKNFAGAIDSGFSRALSAWTNTIVNGTKSAVGFDQDKLANAVAQQLVKEGVVAEVDEATIQASVNDAINRATNAIGKALSQPLETNVQPTK